MVDILCPKVKFFTNPIRSYFAATAIHTQCDTSITDDGARASAAKYIHRQGNRPMLNGQRIGQRDRVVRLLLKGP